MTEPNIFDAITAIKEYCAERGNCNNNCLFRQYSERLDGCLLQNLTSVLSAAPPSSWNIELIKEILSE